MTKVLEAVNGIVWGLPVLIGIIGVGIYLTLRTRFAQVTLFPRALSTFCGQFLGKKQLGGRSSFRALCTALAATVGTGNIAGVAGAIALGGPGAVFWMWICAFLGMVTKFAEAVLAVRYHALDQNGERVSGPMYMIRNGLGKRWDWLGGLYCFFGVVAAFGVGNATQINTLVGGINDLISGFGVQQTTAGDLLMGVSLAVLILMILRGGAGRIGAIAEMLVPFASVMYLLLGAGVLIVRASELSNAFSLIFLGAFSPEAVTGGMLGSAFTALRTGASRGTFTNEAGMGTAAIAHGSAQVRHPVDQGLMGIVEVFLDTIVICTMTALVILTSGVGIPYGMDVGASLTTDAFSLIYGPWIRVPLVLALCCFSIATILGWGLYGARCAQYLFGDGAWKIFTIFQGAVVVLGAVLKTGTVWMLAEIVNGLMAIPNLIVLMLLSPELVRLTNEYKIMCGRNDVAGGTYENIHKCKSLRAFSYEKVPPPGC
ncbi:MAG: sodium:alanine symporter family protein [Oscillospiraceae bacterium]|nr:sodium:alanine symporter family protein [Oscillospiraceae bacterium]